jgi:hypothetical protein
MMRLAGSTPLEEGMILRLDFDRWRELLHPEEPNARWEGGLHQEEVPFQLGRDLNPVRDDQIEAALPRVTGDGEIPEREEGSAEEAVLLPQPEHLPVLVGLAK